MSTTPNMQLVVPEVLVTTGPQYATQINTALDLVDAHDHSPGKGVRITPSGLNINTDLPFNNSNATSLKAVVFQSQASVLTNQALYSKSGNLCFRDSSGNEVQLTASGQINVSSVGAITGLTNPAVAAFVSLTDSFVFQSNASTYAKLEIGDVLVYSRSAPIGTAQAVTLVADATTSAYSLRLPIGAPSDNQIMRMKAASASQFVSFLGTTNQVIVTHNTSDITLSLPQNIHTAATPQFAGMTLTGTLNGTAISGTTGTFSGAVSGSTVSATGLISTTNNISATGTVTSTAGFSGPGYVPIGAIMAIGDAGAWALPASGAIKDGYALCNGQAKPAGSAVGLAATLPDLTDDRFLNGSTAVGGTGGTTAKTTTGIAATFNKNVMNNDQPNHSHQLPFYSYSTSGSTGIVDWYLSQQANGSSVMGTTTNFLGSKFSLIGQTGGVSANIGSVQTVALTNSASVVWNSAIVSTTVTQGTISDIRPKYFNVVYVMRVA